MRALAVIGLTCAMAAAAPAAPFDQWFDPDLDHALQLAKVIAVGTVSTHETQDRKMDTHTAKDGYTVVTVEQAILGDAKPGGTIRFRRRGRHAAEKPAPKPGTKVLVILLERDGELSDFSASYGVFTVKDGRAFMPIRDPLAFMHVALAELGTLARFLRAKKPDRTAVDAWVAKLVKAAARTKPETKTLADVEAQVWAAEACWYFGVPAHAAVMQRYLASPYPQVRRSAARALAGCGGEAAAAALVAHLPGEKEVTVQSDVGRALFRLAPPPAKAAIEAALPAASKEWVGLRPNLMNPQVNGLPSPHAALTAALKRLNGEPGDFFKLSGWRGNPWRRDVERAAAKKKE